MRTCRPRSTRSPIPPAIFEDDGPQTIALTGITAGGTESQELRVTATSSNPSLIGHPTVSYTSPETTGSITYYPTPGQSGGATITVTVTDAGLDGVPGNADDSSFVQTFTVTVEEEAAWSLSGDATVAEGAAAPNIRSPWWALSRPATRPLST